MEVLFIWTLVAVACALIAGHKNRSRPGWFVLGFCFSLIALAVLACLRPRQPELLLTTSMGSPTPQRTPGDFS